MPTETAAAITECNYAQPTGVKRDDSLNVSARISALPTNYSGWGYYQNTGNKQGGQFDVSVSKEGQFVTKIWFSQALKFDGDTFGAVVIASDEHGRPIYSQKFTRGINARGPGGSTKVVCLESIDQLAKEDAESIFRIHVRFTKLQGKDDLGRKIERVWESIVGEKCSKDSDCGNGEHCLVCGKSRSICMADAIQCCDADRSMTACNTNTQTCKAKIIDVGAYQYFCEDK